MIMLMVTCSETAFRIRQIHTSSGFVTKISWPITARFTRPEITASLAGVIYRKNRQTVLSTAANGMELPAMRKNDNGKIPHLGRVQHLHRFRRHGKATQRLGDSTCLRGSYLAPESDATTWPCPTPWCSPTTTPCILSTPWS